VNARINRLSLADLTNLAFEGPDTPMHQGALGVLEGKTILDAEGRMRIDQVRAYLAFKLDRVPALRQVLFRTRSFEGRPLWVDDPAFRIENHILVARLPAPGGEEQASRFAEQKMGGLMDRSRPMWELWFLEGYGEGKVGIFLKLHHVLADGAAIVNILAQLFDMDPETDRGHQSRWSPSPPPSAGALLLDNLDRKRRLVAGAARRLGHPIVLARGLVASVRGTWEVLKEGRGTPRTSLNGHVGAARRVGVIRMPLAAIKTIAHARHATVNDVFLDLVASGVREVLAERRELHGGMHVHASMAVSLHARGDLATVGNQVGTMIVPLPVSGDDDPDARLALIADATRRAKARQRAAIPQAVTVLIAVSGLGRLLIRHQRLVNVLVTNLPGPQFPLYVAGARLRDAYAIPPIAGNVTLSLAGLSYDGQFDLSMHADAASWPDLDVLLDGIRAGWRRLARQARAASSGAPDLRREEVPGPRRRIAVGPAHPDLRSSRQAAQQPAELGPVEGVRGGPEGGGGDTVESPAAHVVEAHDPDVFGGRLDDEDSPPAVPEHRRLALDHMAVVTTEE
jgi:diacylglycerol O-acyltransferase